MRDMAVLSKATPRMLDLPAADGTGTIGGRRMEPAADGTGTIGGCRGKVASNRFSEGQTLFTWFVVIVVVFVVMSLVVVALLDRVCCDASKIF